MGWFQGSMSLPPPIGAAEFWARPRCHIVMAFRASTGTIDGMFIDIDNASYSLRMGRDRGGSPLIVLGPRFTTGHDGDVAGRFRELDQWVRANFAVGEVAWRWVNEDYDSPDRVPFAGELSKDAPGMYVATGFNGWGIINGTAAAMLIADQALGLPNPWGALYNPARRAPKDFNRGGDTKSLVRSLDGAGGVNKHRKKKIAVWKSQGRQALRTFRFMHAMGCTVTWNNADLTGLSLSRFDVRARWPGHSRPGHRTVETDAPACKGKVNCRLHGPPNISQNKIVGGRGCAWTHPSAS